MSLMNPQNSIQNESKYQAALARIYELMQQKLVPDSAEEKELISLSEAVEAYEAIHHSIGEQTDPIEAIKFRMEQMNLKQKDIAPIFGGNTRASEYLNRKRPLTMKIIFNLHKYLEIPYDLLIDSRESFELDEQAKKQLQSALQN